MDASVVGLIGVLVLFVLLAIRLPVAIAMMAVGFFGSAVLSGWRPAFSTLSNETFEISSFYELSVIPLFILMGNLASASGLSRDLYAAAQAWIGHWRGGLAASTIVGCAGFSALSGSSVASALTMGRVSLPEMRRYGYDDRLATGCVAAGGTLGILIPPSTGFVIYAILTEESIGRLFMAGVVPGLMLAALFVLTIVLVTRWRPALAPLGARMSMPQKLRAVSATGAMLGLIIISVGGIYVGFFTPVEAAGVGACGAFVIALYRRALAGGALRQVLLESARTSATSFMILIGAHVFSPFVALSGLPDHLAHALLGLDLGKLGVLAVILAAYVVLGTFLEGFAMLVLTLPIVFPLIVQLGFDPIWFGVLMVIVLEMGLISPPVGVNVFVVKSIAEDVPMSDIFWGVLPFWLAMLVGVTLIVAFPSIALFLPNTMF